MRSKSLFSDFLGLGPPLRWLGRKLLFLWIRTTVLPADVGAERLSSGAPVLYVLGNNALSSRLVVEEVCARQGIPGLSDRLKPIDGGRWLRCGVGSGVFPINTADVAKASALSAKKAG